MSNDHQSFITTEIPFSRRWKLLLIAWGIGLVASGFPNPDSISIIWFFPLGLIKVVGWEGGHPNDFIVGWVLYLALTVVALVSRPRVLYFTFYIILCILLLLNIAGCHQIIAQMK